MTLPDTWLTVVSRLRDTERYEMLLACLKELRSMDVVRYRDGQSVYEYPYEPPILYWGSTGDSLLEDGVN